MRGQGIHNVVLRHDVGRLLPAREQVLVDAVDGSVDHLNGHLRAKVHGRALVLGGAHVLQCDVAWGRSGGATVRRVR